MTALFTLALITFVGLSIAALVGFMFFVLRLALWVVFLPFRWLFKLLWIPIALVLGVALSGVALPLLLLLVGGVAFLALVTLIASVLLPLLPFLLFGFVVWAIFRPRVAAI